MALLKLCDSDPLIEFLRATYDAIPLRVPDDRIKPLVVFTTMHRKMRYLGPLSDLSGNTELSQPIPQDSELADIKNTSSSMHSWGIVADFMPPFLAALLQIAALDVAASIKVAVKSGGKVSISLSRTRRHFVPPIACAKLIQNEEFRLPPSLGTELGRDPTTPLYLVDCILKAREINFDMAQNHDTDIALKLHADLLGKVAPERLLKAANRLTVTGARPLTFAFTCLQLEVQRNGVLKAIKTPSTSRILGASPASQVASAAHSVIGSSTELFAFDE